VVALPFAVTASRTSNVEAAVSLAANFGFGVSVTSADFPAPSLTLATALSAVGGMALAWAPLPLPRALRGFPETTWSANLQPAGLAPFGQLTLT
jgi:hypothetical protein